MPTTYEIEIRTTQQPKNVGSPTSALNANNLEVYNDKIGLVIPDDFPAEIPSGRLIEGDTLIVRLVNDMPLPLSTGIHWHGIELQNNADGTPVTQNPVPGGDLQQLGGVGPQVGGTYLYKFKVPREGIFWFHPHHFHSTNRVFRGTYGMIIVDSLLEPGLIAAGTIPDINETQRVVLSDITVCGAPGNPANNPGYNLALPWAGLGGILPAQGGFSPEDICDINAVGEDGLGIGGYLLGEVPNIQRPMGRVNEGITVLTNGQNVGPRGGTPNAPAALVPADVRLIDVQPEQGLRLQFVNCATSRYFRLKLTDNLGNNYDLIRIGGEGGLLDTAVLEGGTITGFDTQYDAGEILIPPASRADIVVAIPDIVGVTDLTLWTLDFQKIPGQGQGWANIPTVPVLHLNITGANFVPAYSILGFTNGVFPSTVLRTGPDVVELLGASTASVLDPANFVPFKLGRFDDNIQLTAGGTPSIDTFPGDFGGFMPYSDADHENSTRWAIEDDLLHLSIENTTSAHHPFHLHGFSFQPVSITNGVDTLTWGYQEFRDNVNVPAGATLNFRVKIENDRRFADDNAANVGGALGRWLFHCHIFWHAHRGMISELVIVDDNSGDERPNIDVNGSWTYAPSGMPASRTGTYFLPDGDTLDTMVAHYDNQVPVGVITILSPTTWRWDSHTVLPALPDQLEYIYVTITGNSGRKDQTIFRLQLGGVDQGSDNGDPHITTINGTHYDFQSVGEFQLLGDRDGMVVQTRQTPVATANKITNSYTGLTSCVSVNTAVAAKVGSHYISYQPGKEAGTLDFYLDGKLTKLTTKTMNLDNNLVRGILIDGKMTLRVDYEHYAVLIATPRFWSNHNFHYMNISLSHTHGDEGLMGKIPNGSWLPRLGNGVTFGSKPVGLYERYVQLYQKFADSWRLTDLNSMFTYIPGTSTATFTDKNWPTFEGDCKIKKGFGLPGKIQKPIALKEAKKICQLVTEEDLFNDCVLDVSVTGEKSFADGYIVAQKFRQKATSIRVTYLPEENGKIKLVALVIPLNKKGEKPTGKVSFIVKGKQIGEPIQVKKGLATITIQQPTSDNSVKAIYTNGENEGLEMSESPTIKIPNIKSARLQKITASEHRLVLKYLNDAVRVEDLVYGMPQTGHSHPTEAHSGEHKDHHQTHKEEMIKHDVAKKIMDFKINECPLGFRHWKELEAIVGFNPEWLQNLTSSLSNSVLGEWNDFPVDIPRRGNMSMDGIVHAMMLKSGQVLFITGDQTTLLWDPLDINALTSFEDPTNQPHLMPLGYSQVCAHHAQMSDPDGSVLVMGGGGYGPNPLAVAGYIFNPITKTWRRTANDMQQNKWYPTAVTLGGNKMLIASGKTNDGDMEIFDEATESFSTLTGDDKIFPNLYPGLHILPNNSIFYTRTGFGNAGAGFGGQSFPDPVANPNRLGGLRSAYFTPNVLPNATPTSGVWTEIVQSPIRRVKGMSVTLLKSTPPYTQIMVMGGADPIDNDSYEIINVDSLSAISTYDPPQTFPDGEHRALPSAVLLPTGNVFVCGGISTTNSPCTEYDVQTDSWSARANLGSIRQYHSAALLLPSGKVMMAGWQNDKIEVYSPPYLFQGPQPTLTSVPSIVHHGSYFTIGTPEAADIAKVVLVRPMAVTHQTDSEQRVIELLPLVHLNPTTLGLTAPDGGHPHPIAPKGHYMLFVINNAGIPSVAKWVYLH